MPTTPITSLIASGSNPSFLRQTPILRCENFTIISPCRRQISQGDSGTRSTAELLLERTQLALDTLIACIILFCLSCCTHFKFRLLLFWRFVMLNCVRITHFYAHIRKNTFSARCRMALRCWNRQSIIKLAAVLATKLRLLLRLTWKHRHATVCLWFCNVIIPRESFKVVVRIRIVLNHYCGCSVLRSWRGFLDRIF